MMKTVPDPDATLLSAEDVNGDVTRLTRALERRRSDQRASRILERPDLREMLDRLITSGECANEEEAIERGLRTLVTAVER